MQVWAGIAICAHHATLIYNDTPGNAASRFICNANWPADHANMAQQPDTEGANCAEVAGSNMRAHNWRTRSVCVKHHLHITSSVSVRWWNIISWNTKRPRSASPAFIYFYLTFSTSVCLFLCQTLLCMIFSSTCIKKLNTNWVWRWWLWFWVGLHRLLHIISV